MTDTAGRGNQRAAIKMTPAEVDAFLDECRTMTMCSINHDGSIHAVAMWYGRLDGLVAVETKLKSQKVQNLRRDPRLTCLFEAGETYEELRGVELVGRAEILEDPEHLQALGVEIVDRYYGGFTEEKRPMLDFMLRKRLVVRLQVDRTVSWDHRKLA
jgi:PPOX class probable F420-dependent enzyme